MIKKLVWVVFCWHALSLYAVPLNLRHPAPSPDGSRICFSYQGDLWTVSADGGRAERLTVHVGYDSYPQWSPDGKYIAFSSDRHGNFDLFVIPSEGGSELRVTYHSGDDIVTGWSEGGGRILFTAKRELQYESVWEAKFPEGRAKPLTFMPSFQGRRSPDGDKLLFVGGSVPWWRKGYRGSANCDLFVKDLGSGEVTQITGFKGNDLDGFWAPNGQEVFYLSDSTGIYNVFKRDLRSGLTSPVTDHRINVSSPSLSKDGSLLSYELGGEIYLYNFHTQQGRKLIVEVPSGEKVNSSEKEVFESGATELALSPDGTMLAYVVGGEIFCLETGGENQRGLTASPLPESDLSWSFDSKELIFVSDSEGKRDLQIIRSTNPQESSLALTYDRQFARLTDSDRWERAPRFSPDGKKCAFVRSEIELVVVERKSGDERKISERNKIGELDWSPDSRYLIYTHLTPSWQSDVYIGDSESGMAAKVTVESGNCTSPKFSADGKLIYFIKDNDIYYLILKKSIAEMTYFQRERFLRRNSMQREHEPQPVEIDFEDISSRLTRLTENAQVNDAVLSPDATSFVFSTTDGHLSQVGLDGNPPEQLSNVDLGVKSLQVASDGKSVYFLDAQGQIFSISLESKEIIAHPFHAEIVVDRHERFPQIFEQCWQTVAEMFYDPEYHGVDWRNMRERYLSRARVATETRDLHDVIREMLGELNSSHLNIWPLEQPGEATGYPGVIPDYSDPAEGLKIESIVPNTPAAKSPSLLKTSERIVAVDRVKTESNQDYYRMFEGTSGREVKLDLIGRDGGARTVSLMPLTEMEFGNFMYVDRIAAKRSIVDKLSKGKIGYLHVQQMQGEALERFEADLQSQTEGKTGLVFDLRDNGGGAMHDRFLQLLRGSRYVRHQPRYGESGYDSKTGVDIPIVLLVNERTSSDAEIFAHGFKELKLGTVLGVNTYGAVLGTERWTLIDGSSLTVPTVQWSTIAGRNLENHGVSPDLEVPLDLTRFEKGEDSQLEEAVNYLLPKRQ